MIDTSPAVQYRVDLFSAGLEEDPKDTSLVYSDRRARLEEYRSRWDQIGQVKQSSVELPPHARRDTDGEVLACIQETTGGDRIDVTFIQLPSGSRGIQKKQWVVRGLPKNGSALKMHPGLDLLVVPEILDGGRAFQIHLLQLSDGRPHPLAPVDPTMFHVGVGERNTIRRLVVLISEHRLMVVAILFKPISLVDHSDIFTWDWRNRRKMPKTHGLYVREAQMIDDYRVLWIAEPSHHGEDKSLALWDTSAPQPRQLIFELPSNKHEIVYVPKRLMNSVSIRGGIGLHRADPNHRIIGVVCDGLYGDVHLDDDYVLIVRTADLCAHASTRSAGEHRIRWDKWKLSATIVRIGSGIPAMACVSGSRVFAMVRGVSYTAYVILFRIYDFSPGVRGRRHPNMPPVQDLIVNAGRVLKEVDNATWDFSEDNLLMFNTHSATNRVTLHLWTL